MLFLPYFLGIEVSYCSLDIFLSQRKYMLDLLFENGLLGARLVDTPIALLLTLMWSKVICFLRSIDTDVWLGS